MEVESKNENLYICKKKYKFEDEYKKFEIEKGDVFLLLEDLKDGKCVLKELETNKKIKVTNVMLNTYFSNEHKKIFKYKDKVKDIMGISSLIAFGLLFIFLTINVLVFKENLLFFDTLQSVLFFIIAIVVFIEILYYKYIFKVKKNFEITDISFADVGYLKSLFFIPAALFSGALYFVSTLISQTYEKILSVLTIVLILMFVVIVVAMVMSAFVKINHLITKWFLIKK